MKVREHRKIQAFLLNLKANLYICLSVTDFNVLWHEDTLILEKGLDPDNRHRCRRAAGKNYLTIKKKNSVLKNRPDLLF